MAVDKHKMMNILMLKTGIKYDLHDPIFAIMEMNQILIDECVAHERKVLLEQITNEIHETLDKSKDKMFNLFMAAIFFSCALGMAIGKFIL